MRPSGGPRGVPPPDRRRGPRGELEPSAAAHQARSRPYGRGRRALAASRRRPAARSTPPLARPPRGRTLRVRAPGRLGSSLSSGVARLSSRGPGGPIRPSNRAWEDPLGVGRDRGPGRASRRLARGAAGGAFPDGRAALSSRPLRAPGSCPSGAQKVPPRLGQSRAPSAILCDPWRSPPLLRTPGDVPRRAAQRVWPRPLTPAISPTRSSFEAPHAVRRNDHPPPSHPRLLLLRARRGAHRHAGRRGQRSADLRHRGDHPRTTTPSRAAARQRPAARRAS